MPLANKSDYPDWMNPMLVKDSRQSFRSKWFSIVWIVFPLIICLIIAIQLHDIPEGEAPLFNFLVTISLIVFGALLPGFASKLMKDELMSANLDLLVVAPVPANKVIDGILSSVLIRTFLFACMLLPVGAVFYFIDGHSPLAFAAQLLITVSCSVFISLVFMFGATLSSLISRILVIGAFLMGWLTGGGFIIAIIIALVSALGGNESLGLFFGVLGANALGILILKSSLYSTVAGPYERYATEYRHYKPTAAKASQK